MPNTRPQIRPPTLRTGEAATASRLELFFDLAYVLVVLELADAFYGDLSWRGFAVFVALYVAMWFSWVGFTLYANRFDTDDVVFRIAKLAATATIAGCAASASAATGEFSTPFALCFLAGRVILLLLLLRAWRHVPEARPTIAGLSGLHRGEHGAVGRVARLRRRVRYGLWAAAVAMDALGPVIATRREDRAPLHMEHLPERFGLFIILVLGEAVGGAATGVHDAKWTRPGRRRRDRRVRRRRGAVVELLRRHRRSQRGGAAGERRGRQRGGGGRRRAARPVRLRPPPALGRDRHGRGRDRGPGGAPVRRPAVATAAGPSPPGSPCTCSGRP